MLVLRRLIALPGVRLMAYLLLAAAVFFVVLLTSLYFQQGRLIFMPTTEIYRTPADVGWAYEDILLDVAGESTHAWFIPAAGAARGVALFSHGNAGNIADRIESIGLLRDLGFDVLAYDYGGYGRSTGKPGEARIYADVRACWRYLTEERGVAPENILLFGRSLGAAPTTQLATEVTPGAVIIESAFLSIADMAHEIYPFLPPRLPLRHRLDNASKIANVNAPLLVVHSPDDEIIPYEHGRRLFELAPEPKAFLEISGLHNEGFWKSGDVYLDGLDEFLTPIFGSR